MCTFARSIANKICSNHKERYQKIGRVKPILVTIPSMSSEKIFFTVLSLYLCVSMGQNSELCGILSHLVQVLGLMFRPNDHRYLCDLVYTFHPEFLPPCWCDFYLFDVLLHKTISNGVM